MELTARIAELTELLEELRSDKEMLLRCMDCDDEKAIPNVKKQISQMEQALKQLEQQESQYAAELDAALEQYAKLQAQAAGLDPVELYHARRISSLQTRRRPSSVCRKSMARSTARHSWNAVPGMQLAAARG